MNNIDKFILSINYLECYNKISLLKKFKYPKDLKFISRFRRYKFVGKPYVRLYKYTKYFMCIIIRMIWFKRTQRKINGKKLRNSHNLNAFAAKNMKNV